MPKLATRKIFSLFAALPALIMAAFCPKAGAQSVAGYDERAADYIIWESKLQRQVEFYCDSLLAGRASGTAGAAGTSFELISRFRDLGLLTVRPTYSRSFYAKDRNVVGHNVIGMIPGSVNNPVDSYVIVAAHFDNIGVLDGRMYPGADSNASGVVAMTSLAEMFSYMKTAGKDYTANIIFVALDAGRLDLAGAYSLWDDIKWGRLRDPLTGKAITPDKIRVMVNIDQIGSSLSPLRSGREDFIIMLGNQSLPQDFRNLLYYCNRHYSTGLELSSTYYGSSNFTRVFYTISDQRPFVENEIPAVMFTSGITMNTNKINDTPETLNYPVLCRRISLIYHWIDKVASSRTATR